MLALAAGMGRAAVVGAEMDDLLEVVAESALGQRPDHLALEFVEFEDEIAGRHGRPAERDGRGRDADRVLDETSRTRACRLRLDLILHPEAVELGQALLVAAAQSGGADGAETCEAQAASTESAARASKRRIKPLNESGPVIGEIAARFR